MRKASLTDEDHGEMDHMLRRVLQAFKGGEITETAVASCMAHLIAAVDIDNISEARAWFRQSGVELFKETDRISGRVGEAGPW